LPLAGVVGGTGLHTVEGGQVQAEEGKQKATLTSPPHPAKEAHNATAIVESVLFRIIDPANIDNAVHAHDRQRMAKSPHILRRRAAIGRDRDAPP